MNLSQMLKQNKGHGFGDNTPKNEPCATKIKITPVVYSEFFLKVGHSGQISVFMAADT